MRKFVWLPIALFAAISARVFAADAGAQRLLVGPYLQNVKENSMVVMWETAQPGMSRVEYGETEALGKTAADDNLVTIHEVTLTGLATGTKYFYKVTSDNFNSGGSFHTTVAPGAPFRFAVWGDNRTDFWQHTQVAEGTRKAAPDLAVSVGDVVTDGTKYEQWSREFFFPIRKLARNVPFFVAIGNHEKNADWFYKYLSQPAPENYFSYNYGNAIFIILDSNGPIMPGMPQYDWLKKVFKSDDYKRAVWRFVFMHHPLYSEGWDKPGYDGDKDKRITLQPLFEKYKVDIVFAGHTHDYERGELNGVVYIVSGGGGASLDTFQVDIPHMTVYKSTYQFCALDIAGKSLRFDARTPDGKPYDSFTREKN